MKKTLTFISLLVVISVMSSCKKCSTCIAADDPELTSEVCGSGRTYTDEIETYEKANWKCTKN